MVVTFGKSWLDNQKEKNLDWKKDTYNIIITLKK